MNQQIVLYEYFKFWVCHLSIVILYFFTEFNFEQKKVNVLFIYSIIRHNMQTMNLKTWVQRDAWWQAQQDAKSLATVLIRKH